MCVARSLYGTHRTWRIFMILPRFSCHPFLFVILCLCSLCLFVFVFSLRSLPFFSCIFASSPLFFGSAPSSFLSSVYFAPVSILSLCALFFCLFSPFVFLLLNSFATLHTHTHTLEHSHTNTLMLAHTCTNAHFFLGLRSKSKHTSMNS